LSKIILLSPILYPMRFNVGTADISIGVGNNTWCESGFTMQLT